MENILKYIPGFRSNKTWKKVVASIFYFISIIISLMLKSTFFLEPIGIVIIGMSIVDFIGEKRKLAPSLLIITAGLFIMAWGLLNWESAKETKKIDTMPIAAEEEKEEKTTKPVSKTVSKPRAKPRTKSRTKPKEVATLQDYRVIDMVPMHVGGAKRYEHRIVVDEKVTTKQLKDIADEVIKKAKGSDPFNAIVINFYDYEDYAGSSPTLGKVEYAPYGDWSKAGEVKTGDYSSMKATYKLLEKDWNNRLTQEEVEIYRAWKDRIEEGMDEDEAIEEVAGQHSISVEEVNNTLIKQMNWAFEDN